MKVSRVDICVQTDVEYRKSLLQIMHMLTLGLYGSRSWTVGNDKPTLYTHDFRGQRNNAHATWAVYGKPLDGDVDQHRFRVERRVRRPAIKKWDRIPETGGVQALVQHLIRNSIQDFLSRWRYLLLQPIGADDPRLTLGPRPMRESDRHRAYEALALAPEVGIDEILTESVFHGTRSLLDRAAANGVGGVPPEALELTDLYRGFQSMATAITDSNGRRHHDLSRPGAWPASTGVYRRLRFHEFTHLPCLSSSAARLSWRNCIRPRIRSHAWGGLYSVPP